MVDQGPPVIRALEPGRARFATSIAADIGMGLADVRWVLGNFEKAGLVVRRGAWWRLTEWGVQARAGEEPPVGWPAQLEEGETT